MLDARHPEAVLVYAVRSHTDGQPLSWWVVAAVGVRMAAFAAIAGYGVARWAAASCEPPQRVFRATMCVVGIVAGALAVLGAGGVSAQLGSGGAAVATPDSAVATGSFDAVVGAALVVCAAVGIGRSYGAQPRSAPARVLFAGVVAVPMVLGAAGVVAVATTARDVQPRLLGAAMPSLAEGAGSSAGGFTVEVVPGPPTTYTPEDLPQPSTPMSLSERLAARLPHGRAGTGGECQDESVNVTGTHRPRACSMLAFDQFDLPGATGTVEVDHFAAPRELAYQYNVELRYMRQYDGLRAEGVVRRIPNSRMFHTGADGDLFAVVLRTRSDLVVEFVSSWKMKSLTSSQQRTAIRIAHNVIARISDS